MKLRKGIKLILLILILVSIFAGIWYYRNQREEPPKLVVEEYKGELNFISFGKKAAGFDQPMTYIVIFQNSMELRPTGGFIGSFAKITVDKGKITEKKIYDTGVFDATIENGEETPFILKKFLNAPYWGLRDANWYYNFPSSSQKIMDFYKKSSEVADDEKIDGVIAVTTNILPALLEKTGSLTLPGIEGDFTAENALEKLEFEVEKGYYHRGEEKENRKAPLKDLADILISRLTQMGKLDQVSLITTAKNLLNEKDVQLFFLDEELEAYARGENWAGVIAKTAEDRDYLAVVDSNLGALKTDRCMERNISHVVDFTNPQKPVAKTTITYKHTCQEANFMTGDYHSYLQIFVPGKSQLVKAEGFDTGRIEEIMQGRTDAVVETVMDKTIFANLAYVFLGKDRTYSFTYQLPNTISADDYVLYFQRQAGMNPPHLQVIFKDASGERTLFDKEVKTDILVEK